MKKIISIFFVLLISIVLGARNLRLPSVIGDDMVLQQKSDVPLWGWARPQALVTVSASWSKSVYRTTADDNGLWKVFLSTPAASFEAQTVLVKSESEAVRLENILIGEVWLCGGQSNMEMPLGGYPNQPVQGQAEILRSSENFKYIRMATIEKEIALSPQDECDGHWQSSGLNTTYKWSATAFFFGKYLFENLDVPIGLINVSWGGSSIENWMSRENLISLGENPEQIEKEASRTDVWPTERPTVMYNKMLWPLRHFRVAGFIWYQGCSNVNKVNSQNYAEYMSSMVDEWRTIFTGAANAPFYYVQLAPYQCDFTEEYPILREYQRKAQYIIPNCGMAATCDLVHDYEEYCIHPRQKAEVGYRLALHALQGHYGIENLQAFNPELVKLRLFPKDSRASVEFNRMLAGFCFDTRPEDIPGFEVCGPDGVWHPAQVDYAYNEVQLVIKCREVSDIREVRYMWGPWFGPAKLWNSYHMPILPFNTAVTPCERQTF